MYDDVIFKRVGRAAHHNVMGAVEFDPRCPVCLTRRAEMVATKQKFWMIVGDKQTGNPQQKYYTKKAAMQTAAELARKHNGRFYLLEAIDFCEPSSPPVVWNSKSDE